MVQDNRWAMLGFCVTSIGVSAGLIGSVGSIVLSAINQSITDLKSDNKDIRLTMAPLLTLYAQHKSDEDRFNSFQTQIDAKLDKGVHELFDRMISKRVDILVDTDTSALNETLHQVHDLEARIVSRDENVVHWNAVDALTLRVNSISERQCK